MTDAAPIGDVEIRSGEIALAATVAVPAAPWGVVVFAHGSGSGRTSPRNLAVAGELGRAGLATVLPDLLSPVDRRHGSTFDVGLLADRLADVIAWTRRHPLLGTLPLALFGSGSGAAAAIWAAGRPGAGIAAIVARGGRPDLAASCLDRVTAPTLLVVGERDAHVLRLNRAARLAMGCETRLAVVTGASHLFEELGALDEVARLAHGWFRDHLQPDPLPDRLSDTGAAG